MEELTLIQWILSIEEQGLLLIARTIRDIATLLLQKRTDTTEHILPIVS